MASLWDFLAYLGAWERWILVWILVDFLHLVLLIVVDFVGFVDFYA